MLFFFCEGFISEFKKLWDFSIRSPSGVLQISTLYQYFMIHKSVDFLCVSTQDRTANIILKSTDELWLVLMHNVGVIFIIFWLEYGLYFCVHSQKYCKPLVLEDLSYYRTVRGKLDPFLNYYGIFNIHYLVQDSKSSPANKLFFGAQGTLQWNFLLTVPEISAESAHAKYDTTNVFLLVRFNYGNRVLNAICSMLVQQRLLL